MSFSKSKASTTQATTSTSRNLVVEDVEGITISEAGGDVTIVQTDQNAFGAAADLARRAVDVGESLALESQGTIARSQSESLTFAQTFADRAFGVVDKSLQTATQAGERATAQVAGAFATSTGTIDQSTIQRVIYAVVALGAVVAAVVIFRR